jgi:hypothetical protein
MTDGNTWKFVLPSQAQDGLTHRRSLLCFALLCFALLCTRRLLATQAAEERVVCESRQHFPHRNNTTQHVRKKNMRRALTSTSSQTYVAHLHCAPLVLCVHYVYYIHRTLKTSRARLNPSGASSSSPTCRPLGIACQVRREAYVCILRVQITCAYYVCLRVPSVTTTA